MKGLIRLVTADKIIKRVIGISTVLLVIEFLYSLFFYFFLPPYIPLFNQMPWGESRLGDRIEIFLPVFITFFFFILNLFLLNRLYEKMPLVSRIISITTFLITVLSIIFIIRTLQLVI